MAQVICKIFLGGLCPKLWEDYLTLGLYLLCGTWHMTSCLFKVEQIILMMSLDPDPFFFVVAKQ